MPSLSLDPSPSDCIHLCPRPSLLPCWVCIQSANSVHSTAPSTTYQSTFVCFTSSPGWVSIFIYFDTVANLPSFFLCRIWKGGGIMCIIRRSRSSSPSPRLYICSNYNTQFIDDVMMMQTKYPASRRRSGYYVWKNLEWRDNQPGFDPWKYYILQRS